MYVQNLQSYQEKMRDEEGKEYYVDANLWMKALQVNPNSRVLYPEQISSVSKLSQRIKSTQVFQYSAIETVLNFQNKISEINNVYDNKVDLLTCEVKKKLQLIKSKHLKVIARADRLAMIVGKSEKNIYLENLFTSKLQSLKNFIDEDNNYKNKIKELSNNVTSKGFENNYDDETDFLKDVDNSRIEKNMGVLEKMKKIFDDTMTNLRNNEKVVNVIQKDLENLRNFSKNK